MYYNDNICSIIDCLILRMEIFWGDRLCSLVCIPREITELFNLGLESKIKKSVELNTGRLGLSEQFIHCLDHLGRFDALTAGEGANIPHEPPQKVAHGAKAPPSTTPIESAVAVSYS